LVWIPPPKIYARAEVVKQLNTKLKFY
jgi:hypothetical protein